ncbi:MAG: carboxypeptidase regulatory-like domain-containing protein [Planctomycetes bacterium]|nr:carboxypeptidase regulatory-like domain-containing protein [Planctomycetota bacterium]
MAFNRSGVRRLAPLALGHDPAEHNQAFRIVVWEADALVRDARSQKRRWMVLPSLGLLLAATVGVIVLLLFTFMDYEAVVDREERAVAVQRIRVRRLRAAERLLVIRVVDQRGRPVRGALVSVRSSAYQLIADAPPTDEDGLCSVAREFIRRADASLLEVRAPGYRLRAENLSSVSADATRQPHVISVEPTTALVVRAEGRRREPVAGVRVDVQLRSQDPAPVEAAFQGVTGEQGVLRFEGLCEGQWHVSASGKDLEIAGERTVSVAPGVPAEVRIRAFLTEETQVMIADPSGRPTAGAFVSIDPTFDMEGLRWAAQVLPDGRLRVPVPPSSLPDRLGIIAFDGTRYVATLRPGSKPPSYEIGAAVPERPAEQAVLAGTVTSPSGSPLRAVVVATDATTEIAPRRHYASTRADGSFQFFDLSVTQATVEAVLAAGTGLTIGPRSLRSKPVQTGLPRTDVRLVINCGATIQGTLHDAAGAPVSGATLEILRVADRAADPAGSPSHVTSATARTDESGVFMAQGLEPGAYRVRPLPQDSNRFPGWVDAILDADKEPAVLRCTESREIRCVVRDLQGRPAPNVTVTAFSPEDRENFRAEVTGEDGIARLRALDPAGRYVVLACVGDLRSTVADPAAPGLVELQVWVDIEPALRIRLTGPPGVAVGGRRLRVLRAPDTFVGRFRTQPDGGVVLPRMAPGRYDVRLDECDDLESATVAVLFPGTREAILQVRPKGGK